MHHFLETTFGPEELEILDIVLEEWRARRGLPKDNPDVELAAAVSSTSSAKETEQSKR
jgi:hypothetical protein